MKQQTKNTIFKYLSHRLKQLSIRPHPTYSLIANIAIALALSPALTQTAYDPRYQEDQASASDADRQAATEKLFTAARTNSLALAREAITEHADINGIDKYGQTPLMQAARKGHTFIVHLLLEHHADTNIQLESGSTALIMAISDKGTESVHLLLAYHANPNIQNKHGGPPLAQAIQFNYPTIIEALILYGADVESAQSSSPNYTLEKQTAVENALQKRHALETMLGQQNWDLETDSPLAIIQAFIAPTVLASIITDYANPYDTTSETFPQGAVKCYIKNNRERAQKPPNRNYKCEIQ